MLFYTQFYPLLLIFAAHLRGLNSLEIGALFSILGATVVAFLSGDLHSPYGDLQN